MPTLSWSNFVYLSGMARSMVPSFTWRSAASEEVAARLAAFPKDPADVREFNLGAFGRRFAGGAVSMKFYCIGQAGPADVRSRIASDRESAGVWQAATLVMPMEAAAIDRLVEDLRRLEKARLRVALLEARG